MPDHSEVIAQLAGIVETLNAQVEALEREKAEARTAAWDILESALRLVDAGASTAICQRAVEKWPFLRGMLEAFSLSDLLENGWLAPRATVYEDDEGEQRAFPHDYGPVYDETVCLNFTPRDQAPSDEPVQALKVTKRWTRVERDPDDGPEQS